MDSNFTPSNISNMYAQHALQHQQSSSSSSNLGESRSSLSLPLDSNPTLEVPSSLPPFSTQLQTSSNDSGISHVGPGIESGDSRSSPNLTHAPEMTSHRNPSPSNSTHFGEFNLPSLSHEATGGPHDNLANYPGLHPLSQAIDSSIVSSENIYATQSQHGGMPNQGTLMMGDDSEMENSKASSSSLGPRKKSQGLLQDDDLNIGRKKIRIEYIEDKGRRHITFSKRKFGIMKKAYELSTLTGTQVLLLVASEMGHVYTFATPKMQPLITRPEGKSLIQTCLSAPDPTGPLMASQESLEAHHILPDSDDYSQYNSTSASLDSPNYDHYAAAQQQLHEHALYAHAQAQALAQVDVHQSQGHAEVNQAQVQARGEEPHQARSENSQSESQSQSQSQGHGHGQENHSNSLPTQSSPFHESFPNPYDFSYNNQGEVGRAVASGNLSDLNTNDVSLSSPPLQSMATSLNDPILNESHHDQSIPLISSSSLPTNSKKKGMSSLSSGLKKIESESPLFPSPVLSTVDSPTPKLETFPSSSLNSSVNLLPSSLISAPSFMGKKTLIPSILTPLPSPTPMNPMSKISSSIKNSGGPPTIPASVLPSGPSKRKSKVMEESSLNSLMDSGVSVDKSGPGGKSSVKVKKQSSK